MMPSCVHLASDLHLGAPGYAPSAQREREFVQWVRDAALGEGFAQGNQATEIHLVGDIFDFWFEYRRAVPKGGVRLLGALAELTDQGFEVFSVSLDSDASRWQKAVEQDQLVWPNHVSDLQGWRNAAAREYGISSIPHTMLIDRDGLILATHLRGSGVESALRGVFGE